MEVTFDPVSDANIDAYITVGTQSYKEHYLHLWQKRDPSPFINAHLTKASVLKALKDLNQFFYLVKVGKENAGILNITIDSEKEKSISKHNLLLNKIYLLNSFSGKGVGSKTIGFVNKLAKEHKKDTILLYAMKKGKPLDFYKKHGYQIIKEAFINLPNVLDKEKEMWLMRLKL